MVAVRGPDMAAKKFTAEEWETEEGQECLNRVAEAAFTKDVWEAVLAGFPCASVEQHLQYIENILQLERDIEDLPASKASDQAKKAAQSILDGALFDTAKKGVIEAAKQIAGIAEDHIPAIADSEAFQFFQKML